MRPDWFNTIVYKTIVLKPLENAIAGILWDIFSPIRPADEWKKWHLAGKGVKAIYRFAFKYSIFLEFVFSCSDC